MVWTDKRLLTLTLAFYDLMGAVLTNVIKGMKHILVVADTKEPLSCNLKTKIISGICNLREMAGVLPGPGKQCIALLLVNGLASVKGRLKGADNLIPLCLRITHTLRCFPPGRCPGHTDAGESAQYWQ